MNKIVFARIGAVFYVLWGLVHYTAAYGVYQFAQPTPLTIEHGRLEQLAFYLASFATAGIALATLNWRNSRLGFWWNAVTIGIADIPFILFVLVPGYMPMWPGILGPVLWIQPSSAPQSRRCRCPTESREKQDILRKQ